MWTRGQEEWSQEKKGFVTSVRCSGPCQYRSLSPLFTAKLTCFLRHIHNGWQAKISDYSAANFTKYHFSFNAQLFSRINNTLQGHFNFRVFPDWDEFLRTLRDKDQRNASSECLFWCSVLEMSSLVCTNEKSNKRPNMSDIMSLQDVVH